MPDPAGPGLFGGILARGGVAVATSDEAWLAALLAAEAALARALAGAGIIGRDDAVAIARACDPASFDVDAIGREAAASGNPVVPLVRQLRATVGGPAAHHVHRGATSQDILDTATMLVARDSLDVILADLSRAAGATAGLATAHRDTLMAARTLLQQALPTTFGLKAATWLVGLDDATAQLRDVRDRRLAVQLGGAAGTLAGFGTDGPAVVTAFAAELDLAEPVAPWHSQRNRIGELAAALGVAAGAIGKPARDVTLLAQAEVGEVREGGVDRGGSSTLPHKRNPIAAVSALAAAQGASGLVASVLGAMVHEHERAAGAWHAEWAPLRSLLVAVGSASAWLADCLENLEVDGAAMLANLERSGSRLLSERIVAALAPGLGHDEADRVVSAVVAESHETNEPFDSVLRRRVAALPSASGLDLDDLLDPRGYLGSAGALVDRVLAAHGPLAKQAE